MGFRDSGITLSLGVALFLAPGCFLGPAVGRGRLACGGWSLLSGSLRCPRAGLPAPAVFLGHCLLMLALGDDLAFAFSILGIRESAGGSWGVGREVFYRC